MTVPTRSAAAPDLIGVQSSETYVGYERTENFASPGGIVRDKPHAYSAPASPQKNQWALGGDWTVESERAVLDGQTGRIVYRFHARDLHLVLGPAPDGKPVRFRVSIDGAPPARTTVPTPTVTDMGSSPRSGSISSSDKARAQRTAPSRSSFSFPGVEAFAFTFG